MNTTILAKKKREKYTAGTANKGMKVGELRGKRCVYPCFLIINYKG